MIWYVNLSKFLYDDGYNFVRNSEFSRIPQGTATYAT